MLMQKYVNFNGIEVWTTGVVIGQRDGDYVVSFNHGGVEFFGLWHHDPLYTVLESA